MIRFAIRRVYEAPEAHDGTRILVDRLWPRGISREKARIDLWLKDIAPSNALRKQFQGHPAGCHPDDGHPEDWETFRAAYFVELESDTARKAAAVIFESRKTGPVTLLYAARDEQKNNAVALRMWLER